MAISLVQVLFVLFIGVVLIVLLTAKFRIHPFFALLIACFAVGFGAQLSVPEVITAVKDGFGNIMKSLGIIIVLGTTLGVVLEHTGSTSAMANYILQKVHPKYSSLAMAVTGFIVGLPIFCDSGYIVLSGLNKSLAKRTNISRVTMSVSLAGGLYSIHCLIPPHPGATAAAGLLGVDYGILILLGILVAIPGMVVGYLWANYAGRKLIHNYDEETEEVLQESAIQPSVIKSFLPIVVPIALIALKSFLLIEANASSLAGWKKVLSVAGDPVIALSIGVLLAFNSGKRWKRDSVSKLLHDAIEKAGGILVIIGAGGAFGAVLQATKIGEHLNEALALTGLGILFPFLLTSILKTALGSSTVAIITAASIILPLLGPLGLDNETGRLLCVLSMGAGSMMISHANDAYFWVISKFSEIDMRTMLKVYTVATILMGLVSFAFVYILSLILAIHAVSISSE
jgi:gluconate:H+ symporter, GntP family